jgi:hypothetical protein
MNINTMYCLLYHDVQRKGTMDIYIRKAFLS